MKDADYLAELEIFRETLKSQNQFNNIYFDSNAPGNKGNRG